MQSSAISVPSQKPSLDGRLLMRSRPNDFYPIMSLPVTFMQNRCNPDKQHECVLGATRQCGRCVATTKAILSNGQKAWQVETATLLTSQQPCRPPFFSTFQLCSVCLRISSSFLPCIQQKKPHSA